MNTNGFYLKSDLIVKISPLKVLFILHTLAALDFENLELTRVAVKNEKVRVQLQTTSR